MAGRCCSSFGWALAAVLLSAAAVTGCIDVGFYDTTCPNAEAIVRQVVDAAFKNDSGVAPALIRLHFHDCFVRGCDGSVLIDSTPNNQAEKDAGPNFPSLRFFDVVDRAKAALEAACPGVVSCADVLAFAARDSVALAGGLAYQVPSGRRDGRISNATEAVDNLPAPNSNSTDLIAAFAVKNLTLEDMVVLSGAHTIGVSHCVSFIDRIYNFPNTTDGIDPKLSKAYAFLLKQICPPRPATNDTSPATTTFMDLITPARLDNKYYVGLTNNLGLFESDAALLTDPAMKQLVDSFVRSQATWHAKFVRSMLKMGQVAVLSGAQGEIRRNCRVVNPLNATAAADIAAGERPARSSSSGLFTGVATS
ncbi:hypothetical protein ACP4OV_006893 [Aristida adscensionis]